MPLAEYEARVDSTGTATRFFDKDGNIVDANDVWGMIAVAGCGVCVKQNFQEFDPVTHENVRRDKRYVKETIHVMVGMEVERLLIEKILSCTCQ